MLGFCDGVRSANASEPVCVDFLSFLYYLSLSLFLYLSISLSLSSV